ncbi:alanine--tRNA ligase [Georgenia sp. Z1344]|uniref:alanine--tRNA ligase n=1 Tax=Georgenia sp. Z1344 TaxID=3416706 RepID=UPI003CF41EAB
MRTAEIHRRWNEHFARHGHEVVPSASLVSPDPSLLFTIAGMVPFIPYIIGTEKAPHPRMASVQKCIRTNDIENVGRTTRHGTFFQMCGNFSFGDYFKQGAIDLSWEFITDAERGLGLDGDRMWITLWDEDSESYDHLVREIGLDPAHIVRLPREENFWDTGQPGPAGPCGEWHYDRGPEFGPEAEGGTVDPGGDRYLEIWNLVFDQFLRGPGQGKDYPLLGELESKSIDTGAGLERMAYLLQGKDNIYETDQVHPVIARTEELTGRRYGADAEDDVRLRLVADHVRSSLMLIGDGVRPGNDGRGYVLRRLIRRAVRSVRLLGVEEAVLPELLPVSRDAMAETYPELGTDFARISDIAYGEEDAFLRTLTAGTTILDTAVTKAKEQGGPTAARLSGADAFALHDTYGFPIDLTLEMAAEQGVSVDEEGFRTLMGEQRQRARADAMAKKSGHVDTSVYNEILSRLGGPVDFLGYHDAEAEGRVVGLLVDGIPAPTANAPADVELVLDRTPFWAEQGGQLADQGEIRLVGGGVIDVADVQQPVKGLSVHRGTLTEGTVTLDEGVHAAIDTERRRHIARAHTATHMIHKSLHEHLGEQATQAGSENSPSRVRFDFRHGAAVDAGVLGDIEGRVNERLTEDLDVTDETMSLDDARAAGAIALFGEKYGDRVRVVSIGGDWSKELCAGTHVDRTGNLGLVTVLGESSIGSGVRRVDALVGAGAYQNQAREKAIVSQLGQLVGSRPDELVDRIGSLMTKLKGAEKQLASLQQAELLRRGGDLLDAGEDLGGVTLVSADLGAVSGADDLRTLALDVRGRAGESRPLVVALVGTANDRPLVVVATNAAAREAGARAGQLVRTASGELGGGGGGKDDVAQGGGTDASAVPAALAAVRTAVAGA